MNACAKKILYMTSKGPIKYIIRFDLEIIKLSSIYLPITFTGYLQINIYMPTRKEKKKKKCNSN